MDSRRAERSIGDQLARVPAFDDAPNDDGVSALVLAAVTCFDDDSAATTGPVSTIDLDALGAQVTSAVIPRAKSDRPTDTLHVWKYGVHGVLD
jgi:hypothetical protein